MNDSRSKNTVRNVWTGIINKAVLIVLPFINRTAIIRILGAEFTGLSSLFSSILEVLNLADLGFNISIVYGLYKPMADKDENQICKLISLYKKIYGIAGSLVFSIGLIMMPFLKHLIKGSYPESINIYVLFLLYLINAGISYFLYAYKEVLLIADQRSDILNNIRTWVSIFRYLAQFVVLIIFRDFYLYLIIQIIFTVINNILVQRSTDKRYPRYVPRKNINLELPYELKTQVGGLMIDRICNVCRNSFDSIITSTFLGLVATAIYSNYYYIFNAVYQFMLVISSSMSASIGNSIVKESTDKNYNDLLKFTFIYAWITGWCTVCLVCLYQHFMRIWVGKDSMLSVFQMILFCIYFYSMNANNIRNQYISGTGMWWKLKSTYVIEAVANLSLNIILGMKYGISGILVATIITIIAFNFIWRSIVLFKNYFYGKSLAIFIFNHLYYALVVTISSFITYKICCFIFNPGFYGLIIKLGICFVVPNVIFLCLFYPCKQFGNTKQFLKNTLYELRRR